MPNYHANHENVRPCQSIKTLIPYTGRAEGSIRRILQADPDQSGRERMHQDGGRVRAGPCRDVVFTDEPADRLLRRWSV